jgi:Fe-S cluster assembly iron-binding protein IscA
MLAITSGADEALTHLRSNIEGLPEDAGIRITQEDDEDGTPGFALEVVEKPESDDDVIEGHPLRVFVAPDAAKELESSALDGEVHGDHVHFGFIEVDENGEPVIVAGDPDAVDEEHDHDHADDDEGPAAA